MIEPSRAVFLSHASQDAEAAARICAALRMVGIEVWFDQSGCGAATPGTRYLKTHSLLDPLREEPRLQASKQELRFQPE